LIGRVLGLRFPADDGTRAGVRGLTGLAMRLMGELPGGPGTDVSAFIRLAQGMGIDAPGQPRWQDALVRYLAVARVAYGGGAVSLADMARLRSAFAGAPGNGGAGGPDALILNARFEFGQGGQLRMTAQLTERLAEAARPGPEREADPAVPVSGAGRGGEAPVEAPPVVAVEGGWQVVLPGVTVTTIVVDQGDLVTDQGGFLTADADAAVVFPGDLLLAEIGAGSATWMKSSPATKSPGCGEKLSATPFTRFISVAPTAASSTLRSYRSCPGTFCRSHWTRPT